jgi:hypothetical protein
MATGKQVPKFNSFSEFWPYYLSEHSNPLNQKLHALGTTVGLFLLAMVFIKGEPLFLIPALVSGYFFAWVGHFGIEHNRPATFTYPLWSFIGDFKMYGLFITGRLGRAQSEIRASKTTAP